MLEAPRLCLGLCGGFLAALQRRKNLSRVIQRQVSPPALAVGAGASAPHLLWCEQAGIQQRHDGVQLEPGADQHDLLPPVAAPLCGAAFAARLAVAGRGDKALFRAGPCAGVGEAEEGAGVLPLPGAVRSVRQPEDAFAPHHTELLEFGRCGAGFVAQQERGQPPAMERAAARVHGVLDVEGGGLRDERAGEQRRPAGLVLGRLEIEQPGAQYIRRGEPAEVRAQDGGGGVEAGDDALDLGDGVRRDLRDLVQHDDVGELYLLREQLGDVLAHHLAVTACFGAQIFALQDLLTSEIVAFKVRRVDHSDEGVQRHDVIQHLATADVEARDALSDGQRLRGAGALDHHYVVALGAGEVADLGEQVLAQCAAHAAVAQLHQLLVLAQPHRLGSPGVDVDGAYVVDDDRGADAEAVVQDVLEQRGFARAEEAREQRDWQALVGALQPRLQLLQVPATTAPIGQRSLAGRGACKWPCSPDTLQAVGLAALAARPFPGAGGTHGVAAQARRHLIEEGRGFWSVGRALEIW